MTKHGKGEQDRRAAERGEDRRGKAGLTSRLRRVLGPGLITGAADDDPAGITTYSQAGAQFQYGLLWTVPFLIPLMSVVQLMCARIGRASGRDLAGVLARHYPKPVLWFAAVILLLTNTVTAAADLEAIAAALSILTGVSARVYVPMAAVAIVALVTFSSYDRLRGVLKWTTLALLSYVVAGFLARPDWLHVARATFIPELQASGDYLYMFVALFGTTISPYLFFWQSAEEIEEEKAAGRTTVAQRRGTSHRVLRLIRADTLIGMTLSQLIGFFVMLSAGTLLFAAGHQDIRSAGELALALRPLGGGLGTLLFCVGFIGTGAMAIPTLTGGAAYVLAALFGWKTGIGERPRRAPAFYISMAATTALAVALSFTHFSAVQLLVGSAVLNGLLAPPLLMIILHVANDEHIMAGHTNGRVMNGLGLLATILMTAGSLALLFRAFWGVLR